MHRFVDEGLFRYCRHPNYFGEMLLWTSLTALAGGPGVLTAHPWVAVSPAFTIFLLTQASGACSPEYAISPTSELWQWPGAGVLYAPLGVQYWSLFSCHAA